MNDNDKYIVDIAREKVYQNQYDDYHETFAKWRTAENNPYGYSFVHDTREHTYVDGEGYYHKSAEAAEKSALSRCLGLLGITLLIMTLLDAVSGLVFYEVFQDPAVDEIYFSQVHVHKDVSPLMALFFGGMSLVKNLVGLWIFLHFTKIPTKVAIPMPKDSKILKSGLFLMLTIMVFGRVCNFIINFFLGWMHIDSVYALGIHNPDNYMTDVIYLVFNCVLVSIVSEILFRGAILQTFRQFGDTYAMLVSCVAFSLTCYDISTLGFAVLCSTALGLYTIKTGSLKTPVLMRIVTSVTSYMLACLTMDNATSGRLIEVCLCTFITSVSAFVFARLMCNGKWSFKIYNDPSQLTNGSKIRMLFTNTYTAITMVMVLGMYFLMVRFI